MVKLLEKATNPAQYDLEEVVWAKEIEDSPTRRFYYEYLGKYEDKWKDADILDIGCGTGWLMNLLLKNGARLVEGAEPSIRNARAANKLYPSLKVFNSAFESFSTERKYDLIISVMVFSHISDINSAFRKLTTLLKESGEAQIVVPDYDYFKKTGNG